METALFILGRILSHINQVAAYAQSKKVPVPKLAAGFTGLLLLSIPQPWAAGL